MIPVHRPPRFHRPNPFSPFHRPPYSRANFFLHHFKKPDGQWDFDKISKSIQEANKLVGQVQPIIQQFSTIFKKR